VPRFAASISRSARLWLGLVAVAGAASCIEWDRSTTTETRDIRLFITHVLTLSETPAVFNPGMPPVGGTGPLVTASVPQLVLRGGAVVVTFTSDVPFSRVVVSVQGVPGYFDLTFDQEATTQQALIAYAQDVGAPSFTMHYAGVAGDVGPFQATNTAFLGNGTGDVQVNLTWNTPADVDLYVVDPFGEEYFYNHRGGSGVRFNEESGPVFTPTSGGILDIDSNAGCGTDGPRAENIFWPQGVSPPPGRYTVRVNYWSNCDAPFTDYVVTIRVRGQVPETHTGRFTGAGVGGAEGAGLRIGDFTVTR
jgi:hypothetical protein